MYNEIKKVQYQNKIYEYRAITYKVKYMLSDYSFVGFSLISTSLCFQQSHLEFKSLSFPLYIYQIKKIICKLILK